MNVHSATKAPQADRLDLDLDLDLGAKGAIPLDLDLGLDLSRASGPAYLFFLAMISLTTRWATSAMGRPRFMLVCCIRRYASCSVIW